jgi:hypothetical protein
MKKSAIIYMQMIKKEEINVEKNDSNIRRLG